MIPIVSAAATAARHARARHATRPAGGNDSTGAAGTVREGRPPAHASPDLAPPTPSRRAEPGAATAIGDERVGRAHVEAERVAVWWPAVLLAAVVTMSLGVWGGPSMRAPLLTVGVVLLTLGALMRSRHRRVVRRGQQTTANPGGGQ
jgi:hypothetical protein